MEIRRQSGVGEDLCRRSDDIGRKNNLCEVLHGCTACKFGDRLSMEIPHDSKAMGRRVPFVLRFRGKNDNSC